MESECHCPACLKTFQDTNKLSCGHVFCGECVSKIERMAQKTSTKPACPVCLCEFNAASKETPHPSSLYHDKLVARSDPKRKIECAYCDEESSLVCKDGCGFVCGECQENYHSKIKKYASHKVVALLEVDGIHRVDLRGCILHNLPIISVCNQCWPVSEMCSQCGFDDLSVNKTHEYIKVEKIEYEAINEDELIEKIQTKLIDISAKKETLEIELKKIARKEEEQLAKIEKLYDEIVEKASQLKSKLTENVREALGPKSSIIESIRHRTEISENVLKHSATMLKESKDIYAREKIVTKLFKSAIFAKKTIALEIDEIETIEVGDFKCVLNLDGDILVDGNGAHVLDTKFESVKSEYEKCVTEIERFKRTSDDCQRRADENAVVLKRAQERIQILEDEVNEYRKEKERLEKQKDEEEKVLREKMGIDLFQRMWRFDAKDYKYQSKIGSQGNGSQQFYHPEGITVHPKSGHIYIADVHNHRVQVLDENMQSIRAFGSSGSTSGQFNQPRGVAVSLDGRVAVCEHSGNRIQIFDENNTVLATIQSGQKKSQRCTQANDFDGFSNLRYVCFDAEGNLYVTNQSKNRVDKFNREYEFECSFAQSSLGDRGISSPHGICITSKNEVCVAGSGGDKINIYDSNGLFIRTLKIQKVPGNVSIAEGPNNTILVSEYGSHQIRVYDTVSGKIVHTFGSTQPSTADGCFSGPMGMCFGLNQKLYVCDFSNHRIQVFSA